MTPLTFVCAVENTRTYTDQALRLLASIRWFAGAHARAPFVVGALEPFPEEVDKEFARLGATVVPLPRFDAAHGPSNKIALLGLPELEKAACIALLDCDTLVLQDLSAWLAVKGVAAKPADLPTVMLEQLGTLHDAFGLSMPRTRHMNDVSESPTIHYVNGGVILINQEWRARLYEAWRKFGAQLIDRHGSLGIPFAFSDQASLALAISATGAPFEALPTSMNMPVHLDEALYPESFWHVDPIIVHYHWLSDFNGYVTSTPFPLVNLRMDAFNACLRTVRAGGEGRFKKRRRDSAGRRKILVGTGWWSGKEPHAWSLGAAAITQPAFFDIWYRQVVRYINPMRIVVTDSASSVLPDWRLYPDVLWITLDRNYGHANDIRTGKIETKYSGFTRSVINGAMQAICCDADIYVYLEQDCLIRGYDIVDRAIGGIEGDIFMGAPTHGGRGLDGKPAAPMLQQSFMIVTKPGLERFVSGILSAPWSDGEVSPEEIMRLRLQPVSELAIPYGRSRPIDFGRSHFYAQHLTDAELGTMLEMEGIRPPRSPATVTSVG